MTPAPTDPQAAALKLFAQIASRAGQKEDVIAGIQGEDLDVLIRLEARLAASPRFSDLSSSVRLIIARRQHSEQIESQDALRDTMERVADTLVAVETRQRRIEYVGLFVGFAGLILAGVQVWVAVYSRSIG